MGVIIRQSAKSTIVNYFGIIIGFISTMFVMTEFLTPEELGLTRVMLDIAVLLSGFFMLGAARR